MAILTRVDQKIFGSTGSASNFGQIGSQTAGSPVNTKDLDTIQALAGYLAGLRAITNSNEPYLEDINSLYLLITSQIKYLFQNGIPEYSATEPYYNQISFVQVNGVLYQSINGTSGTPNTGNAPASSPTKWKNVDPGTLADAMPLKAPLASPALTGNPTAPTQSPLDNSTKISTTAYADAAVLVEKNRALAAEAAISGASGLAFVQTAVEQAGFTWDPTDAYMLDKANIATSHLIGEDLFMNNGETQVYFSAARSTANPSFPRYNPLISRAVDKTITSAMAPLLVTKMRAFAVSVLGVSSFTGTVSGSVITFANTTVNNQLIAALIQEALVRQWFVSQDPNFAATGPLYTGMTINVNGSDFAISAASLGGHTITVSGSPTTGSQTCIVYPYRIVASSTSIFLPGTSGFVPVGSGDADAAEIGGLRHMDTIQSHGHGIRGGSVTASAISTNTQSVCGMSGTSSSFFTGQIGSPITDGNGDPRNAKNTSPRSSAKFQFIWAGVLNAAA